MGDSQKLSGSGPSSYNFVEHRRCLDALRDALDVRERVTFTVDDWGVALGFDWSYRHPEAVKGIAYMQAIVKPYAWSEYPEVARKTFWALRSPAGEQMVLEQNSFIEFNLPKTILRSLTEEEVANYRRPFSEPGEARRPMLSWARRLLVDGDPADVTEIVTAYGEWLARSDVPSCTFGPIQACCNRVSMRSAAPGPRGAKLSSEGSTIPRRTLPTRLGMR